jgi:hypothetical protein
VLISVEQANTLPPEQNTADDGGQKNHAKCRPDPDLPADDNKGGNLGQWHDEQQERDQGEAHEVCPKQKTA